MAKEYMVGTLDDTPLVSVTYNGVKYFVDNEKKEVYLDKKGLPKVDDKEIIEAVLGMAQ